MGGNSSSTRSITITEDEATGTVQISEAVARRLLGKPELPEATAPTQHAAPVFTSSQNADPSLEQEYKNRLATLEKKNYEIQQISKDAFEQAVKEVESKFLDQTAAPVCDDLQRKVMQCYRDNPKHTLNCSQEVKQFNTCVQRNREMILSAKQR